MSGNSDLRWLGLAVALFLFLNALTYQQDTTETDDLILARLSKQVAVLKPEYLEGPVTKPLETCRECLFEDPFSSMEGNGCRWSQVIPIYSCRIGERPIAILVNPRLGGAQEYLMTWLSGYMGPLLPIKIFKVFAKAGLLAALYWILGIFALPRQILPFIAANPMFYSMGHLSWTTAGGITLTYLAFGLVLEAGRTRYLAGIFCLLITTYIWMIAPFLAIPGIAALYFFRKDTARAAWLAAAACAFLLLRISVNYLHPYLSSSFNFDMVETPIWMKSAEHIRAYLLDLYGFLSLSADRVDLVPSSARAQGMPMLFVSTNILNFVIFILVGLAAFIWRDSRSKRIRALVGLFLISSLPHFIFGHDDTPNYSLRLMTLLPIPLIAIYLSAEAARTRMRERGSRFSFFPVLLIWFTVILGCIQWVDGFRRVGPPMTMNADFASKLGAHLFERKVIRPIVINDAGGIGMVDLFSEEKVRPLYLTHATLPQPPPGADPAGFFLMPWLRLGQGTLLQRTNIYFWDGPRLTRADIESFAAKNGIQITNLEFFPYREKDGYWIVDFKNPNFSESR